MRTGVSLYDRNTGQTALVGPDMSAKLPNGGAANRNVRTMPIAWSTVNPGVLFYVSNVVWKSTDHAHSWTRISPDLTRQNWQVPSTAGKYAATVTPAPSGSITALSVSSRSINILWTGSDDGMIQTTGDGGAHWTDVTPPAIKPWTRIFNIEAGHFDDRTAYAAANTMRIDDMNPHLWRTHDGGKTWTEIDNGIAPGAVTNAIREDPRKRGLLYASTDQQVWVSFDDGDHWESLRLNMPAISVRDLEVKDDSACLCADLIAGTHGRGFWILDDVTPLRQAAEAREAKAAYLFKPITAVRVRFATNDPTPWPPELPAGQNPPPGGIIDYYLPNNATGEVKLEILENGGKVIRSYSSNTPILNPHPALDPAAYNRVCQQDPTAPFCNLPLYWPGPPMSISTSAGMHRVWWDFHYNPVTAGDTVPNSDEEANGAVPHRTYTTPNSPFAPPGNYTVRLTVSGQQLTQPLTLRMDPRVKTPAAGLTQLATLSRDLFDRAVVLHRAYTQARQLASSANVNPTLKEQLDSIAPPPQRSGGRRGGFGRRGGAAATTVTLNAASDALLNAAMAMQSADVAPTSMEIAAADRAKAQATTVMARWDALRRARGQGAGR
jgi:hypothetical protein